MRSTVGDHLLRFGPTTPAVLAGLRLDDRMNTKETV